MNHARQQRIVNVDKLIIADVAVENLAVKCVTQTTQTIR